MPGAVKNFIGREGFIWWIGVVEDRNDPEQLGRVRVRCFGWHNSDKTQVPTDALPWAHPVVSPNAPATYTPKEGDFVFGFFMDADSAQNPVILGVLPGKPKEKPDYSKGFSDPRTDFSSAPQKEAYPLSKRFNEPSNSRLARNRVDGTVIEKRKRALLKGIKSAGGVSWDEPSPKYAPVYPYNYVHETESGHAFELDDTFGKERVNLAHKIGSFMEYDPQGTKVEKIVKDNYSIVMGDDHIYVQGKCSITVLGDCNLKVGGKFNVEASDVNMSTSGDIKMKAGGAIKFESSSTLDAKAGGAASISSGGALNLKGSTASVGGSTINLAGNISNQVKIPPGTDKPGGIGKILTSGSAAAAASAALQTPEEIAAVQADLAEAAPAVDSGIPTPDKLTPAALVTPGSLTPKIPEMPNMDTTSKTLTGITESGSGVLATATNAINSAKDTLSKSLPKIDLQSAMTGFEDTMNGIAGQIQNLAQEAQTYIQQGCAAVQELAAAKDVVVNLASDLVPAAINTAENIVYETGKRLFPSTESVPINN